MEKEIEEVRDALTSIPHAIATVEISCDEYEYRIDVSPTSNDNCRFWLGFSTYDTYGLSFGHGLFFEDIPIAEFRPIDVVRAILEGRIRETVWRRGTKVFKSKGAILLGDGRELFDTAILRLSILPLGKGEEVQYKPYIVSNGLPRTPS